LGTDSPPGSPGEINRAVSELEGANPSTWSGREGFDRLSRLEVSVATTSAATTTTTTPSASGLPVEPPMTHPLPSPAVTTEHGRLGADLRSTSLASVNRLSQTSDAAAITADGEDRSVRSECFRPALTNYFSDTDLVGEGADWMDGCQSLPMMRQSAGATVGTGDRDNYLLRRLPIPPLRTPRPQFPLVATHQAGVAPASELLRQTSAVCSESGCGDDAENVYGSIPTSSSYLCRRASASSRGSANLIAPIKLPYDTPHSVSSSKRSVKTPTTISPCSTGGFYQAHAASLRQQLEAEQRKVAELTSQLNTNVSDPRLVSESFLLHTPTPSLYNQEIYPLSSPHTSLASRIWAYTNPGTLFRRRRRRWQWRNDDDADAKYGHIFILADRAARARTHALQSDWLLAMARALACMGCSLRRGRLVKITSVWRSCRWGMERYYPNFYSLSSAPAEPLDPRFKRRSWTLGLQAPGPLGLERPPLDPTAGLATYDDSTVSGRERSVRTQRCSSEAPISRRVSTFLPDALTNNERDSQQTSAVISDLTLRSQNGFPVTPSTLRTPVAVVKPTVSGLLPYPSQGRLVAPVAIRPQPKHWQRPQPLSRVPVVATTLSQPRKSTLPEGLNDVTQPQLVPPPPAPPLTPAVGSRSPVFVCPFPTRTGVLGGNQQQLQPVIPKVAVDREEVQVPRRRHHGDQAALKVASSRRHSLFEFPTRIVDYGPLTASPLSTVRAKTNAVSPRLPENWSLRRRARRHPELVTTEPLGRRQFMPVTDNSPQPLSTGIEAGSDAQDDCLLSNWLPVSSTPTMNACSTYPWAVACQGKRVSVCNC
uniref:PH domain-containing protein n=1 Tax=Schistocephalus solidus TaxID=70667 RepID=A0A183THG7_SCHSO